MSKVKLLTAMSGPDGSYPYGAVVDMDDAEAARFVAADLAVPVEDAEPAKRTKRAKVETAADSAAVESAAD